MRRLLLLLALCGAALAGTSSVSYTNPGTSYWTVPSGASSITIEVWGSGGNGGTGYSGGGGGGGGGAYAKITTSLTAGTQLQINVDGGGNQNNSNVWNNSSSGYIISAQDGGNGGDGGSWCNSNGGCGGYAGSSCGGSVSVCQSGGGGGDAGGNSYDWHCGGSGGNGANGGGGGAGGCDDSPWSGGGGGSPGGGGGGGSGINGRSGDYSEPAGGGASGQVIITYTVNNPPVVVSMSGIPARVNYGTPFTVTATYRDPDGYADLQTMYALIGYGVDGTPTCYAYLNGGVGGSFTQANDSSYCLFNGGQIISYSGTDATVRFTFTPLPKMITAHGQALNGYMYDADKSGAVSGWSYMNITGTIRTGPKLIVTKGVQ
jgi:hypothetical protein